MEKGSCLCFWILLQTHWSTWRHTGRMSSSKWEGISMDFQTLHIFGQRKWWLDSHLWDTRAMISIACYFASMIMMDNCSVWWCAMWMTFLWNPLRRLRPCWVAWQVSMGRTFIFSWEWNQDLQGRGAQICQELRGQICFQNHHAEVPRHSWGISATKREDFKRASFSRLANSVSSGALQVSSMAWILSTTQCVASNFLLQSWSADHYPRHEEPGWNLAACQRYCKFGNDYTRRSLEQE